MTDFYTAIRWLNVLLCVLAVVMLLVRYRDFHRKVDQVQYVADDPEFADQLRMYGLALFGVLCSNIYGTAESMARSIPGGPRIFILTLPLLWLLIASLWPQIKAAHRWWRGFRQ